MDVEKERLVDRNNYFLIKVMICFIFWNFIFIINISRGMNFF